jgi:citrate lyase subunit beta / citryl-CoA lyase
VTPESPAPIVSSAARRACLVVPGSAPAKLAKAAGLGADEVVLDLEDAVAPEAKDAARAAVVAALGDLDWSGTTVSVRVNAIDTPWHAADLAALAAAPSPPRSVVVPKVERAEDLARVERLLADAATDPGREPPHLQALIETAAGLARVQEIAGACPRLEALVLGYADLAASLGRTAAGAANLTLWDPAREALLLAARAHDLQAIDGPHLGLRPDATFAAAAQRARDQGFDGKWAIHPSQVAPLIERFAPSDAEVAHARAVIDALQGAERVGQGAVAFDGQMIDEPVRRAALRVLARAAGGR